jgi:hypothetical protein
MATSAASISHPKVQRAVSGLAWILPLAACSAIVVTKFMLVGRINVHWDEFFFLSAVHQAARGELAAVLQTAYTHLFQWLTRLDADEVGQVVVARALMAALLAATVVLLWRLACVWVSKSAAVLAPLCYLSTTPVLEHGASFRADSLLAPLCVLSALLLARTLTLRTALCAGVCLGAAFAVSIKAILFAPVVIVLVALETDADGRRSISRIARMLGLVAGAAGVVAVALLALHKLSVVAADSTVTAYASGTVTKTILDVPYFPRRLEYEWLKSENQTAWWLLVAGAVCSVLSPRFRRAGACALSLLPLLFYRNAWPYYYVVMLAPACVMAAVAGENLRQALQALRWPFAPDLATLALSLLLSVSAASYITQLRADETGTQRTVVAAVHRIFPEPVAYIDHSGMIASFRKVNFFMSTWGLENYRAAQQSFVERALAARAPLLLANRPVLEPGRPEFKSRLLPRDRALIEQFYQPYWGPIRVAGAAVELVGNETLLAELPFPGRYRVETEAAISVDGVVRRNGEIIDVERPRLRIAASREREPPSERQARVRLIWAAAHPPPPAAPPRHRLYFRLRS